ncbi:hypothetical protein V8C34DRAFT_77290 [Trichoderma compactum]
MSVCVCFTFFFLLLLLVLVCFSTFGFFGRRKHGNGVFYVGARCLALFPVDNLHIYIYYYCNCIKLALLQYQWQLLAYFVSLQFQFICIRINIYIYHGVNQNLHIKQNALEETSSIRDQKSGINVIK